LKQQSSTAAGQVSVQVVDFPSSFLKVGIVSHIHSDFQRDLKRLTASTLTMKTRIYEDTKGEPFQRDLVHEWKLDFTERKN